MLEADIKKIGLKNIVLDGETTIYDKEILKKQKRTLW